MDYKFVEADRIFRINRHIHFYFHSILKIYNMLSIFIIESKYDNKWKVNSEILILLSQLPEGSLCFREKHWLANFILLVLLIFQAILSLRFLKNSSTDFQNLGNMLNWIICTSFSYCNALQKVYFTN